MIIIIGLGHDLRSSSKEASLRVASNWPGQKSGSKSRLVIDHKRAEGAAQVAWALRATSDSSCVGSLPEKPPRQTTEATLFGLLLFWRPPVPPADCDGPESGLLFGKARATQTHPGASVYDNERAKFDGIFTEIIQRSSSLNDSATTIRNSVCKTTRRTSTNHPSRPPPN